MRPSYSGEHLGGLVESSSAESFVSNKSEDPGVEDHARSSLSGLVCFLTTSLSLVKCVMGLFSVLHLL